MKTLTAKQEEFVESVLRLSPRVATFDCDGTLWPGDVGEEFFAWEMERGLLSDETVRWVRARHEEYRAGKVAEDTMCGEMVTIHHGLREEEVRRACDAYCEEIGLEATIFSEMRELIRRLREAGCEIWAVSSSNQWVVESAMRSFEIPNDRILAAEAAVKDGVVTDRILRVPSGPGKVKAIETAVRRVPDCAFGNAIWDREMLALARHAFAINANANLREVAMASGWTVYQPE